MKHPYAFLLALSILTLAGCSQIDSPLAPQKIALDSTASASANLVSRLWEGTCEGTGTFRLNSVILDIMGTCRLSHLGLTTMVGVETVGAVLNAVHTFTTANGDLPYTTTTGTAVLKPDFSGVTFSNIETVTGGTGRFATATGSATRIGSTNFSHGSGQWVIQGTLTYAASDRK